MQRNPSPQMLQRPVPSMPVRRLTPTNVDTQVWETVRTFEPVMTEARKRISELNTSQLYMRDKISQLEEELRDTRDTMGQELREARGTIEQQAESISQQAEGNSQQAERITQQAERISQQAERITQQNDKISNQDDMISKQAEMIRSLLLRVDALESSAGTASGCSVVSVPPDELDGATTKPDVSSPADETLRRKWDAPPPLPQDLGRTPPRSPRDLAVSEPKIPPAEQENGPDNNIVVSVVHKRSTKPRSLRTAPGPMHPGEYSSREWLRHNFTVGRC
jgi:hypothetical protein